MWWIISAFVYYLKSVRTYEVKRGDWKFAKNIAEKQEQTDCKVFAFSWNWMKQMKQNSISLQKDTEQLKFYHSINLKDIKYNNDPQHKLQLTTSDGNAECCLFYSVFQVFTTKRS